MSRKSFSTFFVRAEIAIGRAEIPPAEPKRAENVFLDIFKLGRADFFFSAFQTDKNWKRGPDEAQPSATRERDINGDISHASEMH